MKKPPKVAHGWVQGFSRRNWRSRIRGTWIAHYENGRLQFDRVCIVPFDEAVKLGIVQQDKQQEKRHD